MTVFTAALPFLKVSLDVWACAQIKRPHVKKQTARPFRTARAILMFFLFTEWLMDWRRMVVNKIFIL